MDNSGFKLNSVKVRSSELENFTANEYTLNFASDEEEKTITLSGLGSLKETVKI